MNEDAKLPSRAAGSAAEPLIWSTSSEGRWLSVGSSWTKLTGMAQNAALGFGWKIAVHPDDHGLLEPRGFGREDFQDVRFRLLDARGAFHRYSGRLHPTIVLPGETRQWIGTARALDPRQLEASGRDDLARARGELSRSREMERRFRHLADSLPQLVWMADENGTVDYYNSRAREYAGLERHRDGTWEWQPMLHPDDAAPTLAAWRSAAGSQSDYSAEHRVRMADGSFRWHLSRARPLTTDDGRVHWYGTATDIHALKTAESAILEAAERYRLVNRATNDVIWNWDLRTNRLEWNDAIRQHFGCTPEDLGSNTDVWTERIHPEDRDTTVEGLHGAIEQGKDSWSAEYRFRKNDGSYGVFLDRGYIARDADGTPTRMIGSMLDVTEHREAEETLRQEDRRKDQLIAMLAHELRNPLAPIRSAVEVLRATRFEDDVGPKARDVIARQATHMAHLIDDLLDASLVSRGKIALRQELCDLSQIVRQTVDDYRGSIEATGTQLLLNDHEDAVWVRGDPTRLAQCLGNLLHNASKYTEGGGKVSVHLAVDHHGGEAVVSVLDDGIGISSALLPHLFDPFSQAEQGLDRSRGGLGLGLSLVKGLIELHGGRVEAMSAGEHQGSTFVLRIPLCECPAAAIENAPATTAPAGLSVLVIEDNHDAAETLELLLSMAGYDVAVAFDGPAGVAAAKARLPDAVICDIGLPHGMDGYAVAQALRADPATATARLVALSGYGQEEDRRRSRAAGFDVHLTKPIDLLALRANLTAPQGP